MNDRKSEGGRGMNEQSEGGEQVYSLWLKAMLRHCPQVEAFPEWKKLPADMKAVWADTAKMLAL